MKNFVTVGASDMNPNRLRDRVRHFGPQTIIIEGRVFELLSLLTLNAGSQNVYLATSPHDPQIFVINPFSESVVPVHPGTRPSPRSVARWPNRVDVARLIQYLAELEDGDLIVRTTRTLVADLINMGLVTEEWLNERVKELLQLHTPIGWHVTYDLIGEPEKAQDSADGLILLALDLCEQSTAS